VGRSVEQEQRHEQQGGRTEQQQEQRGEHTGSVSCVEPRKEPRQDERAGRAEHRQEEWGGRAKHWQEERGGRWSGRWTCDDELAGY
jgi:hypothetical protein